MAASRGSCRMLLSSCAARSGSKADSCGAGTPLNTAKMTASPTGTAQRQQSSINSSEAPAFARSLQASSMYQPLAPTFYLQVTPQCFTGVLSARNATPLSFGKHLKCVKHSNTASSALLGRSSSVQLPCSCTGQHRECWCDSICHHDINR